MVQPADEGEIVTSDFVQELMRFQRYAAGLQDLLARAEAEAPQRAAGADSSGTVRVVLGPGGFPESIRVESKWQNRIDPASFGGAVGEAFSVAMGERMAAWTTALQESGWHAEFEDMRSGSREPFEGQRSGSVPPAFRREAKDVRPRPLGLMAEDMLKAFDKVDEVTNQPVAPVQGTGSVASGNLVLALSNSGGLSCSADPHWVSRQTAATLMTLLSQALKAAQNDLATTAEEGDASTPTTGLEGLFDEAIALLNDPQRLADS